MSNRRDAILFGAAKAERLANDFSLQNVSECRRQRMARLFLDGIDTRA